METKEIQKSQNGIATEIVETTPATLIQLAIQQNVDVDKLEKLMQLQERWEANKARKEFFHALAEFQSKCPVITKNKKADFQSKVGGRINYSYATLDQIIDQLREPLRNNGLSYRWEFTEPEKSISVKCIITHSGGHSEFTTMTGSADTSGVKNDIQARGSTLTYLQRYTLIGALGIGTAQEDVDGKKKTDGGLHPDMKLAIDECKTLPELNLVWDQNEPLHKDKDFIHAVTNRKKTIANGK